MKRRITAAEVIATHIGYDLAEMSEYRYQPTRYPNPAVYAIGDTYYCAPAAGGRLHLDWNWKATATVLGRTVYEAGTEIEP